MAVGRWQVLPLRPAVVVAPASPPALEARRKSWRDLRRRLAGSPQMAVLLAMEACSRDAGLRLALIPRPKQVANRPTNQRRRPGHLPRRPPRPGWQRAVLAAHFGSVGTWRSRLARLTPATSSPGGNGTMDAAVQGCRTRCLRDPRVPPRAHHLGRPRHVARHERPYEPPRPPGHQV